MMRSQLRMKEGTDKNSHEKVDLAISLLIIYTIILHKYMCVCRRSQTSGRNSCSIVSGDVSN